MNTTWRGRERQIGESKKKTILNVTKNIMSQRWHLIPLVICKYIANYFKLNDFKAAAKRL